MTDLRQLHFRFRTDAGTADASPTWGADEDVNYYPGTANFRLRIGLRNASTVVAATPWELYVSRNGDAYTPVTTTIAKGVQSVDAGSSADDTAVLIPRLYPFSPDWELSDAAIDLDFAGSRIYGATAFTDVLSISRASTGYVTNADGTLTSFGTNTLRIGNGAGLLIEDARTNVAIHSQDMAGNWSTIQCTATNNQAVAPDGTTTMCLMQENTLNDQHLLRTFAGYLSAITAGATVTFSVFVKDIDRRFVGIYYQSFSTRKGGYCVADLQTGTITASGALSTGGTFVSASIETFANGIYRISVTAAGDAAETDPLINISTLASGTPGNAIDTGGWVYTGTSKQIYVWGAQLEVGSFLSSYIPTTTVAVTRAADAVTCVGNLNTLLAATEFSAIVNAPIIGTRPGNPVLIGWEGNSARLRYGSALNDFDLNNSDSSHPITAAMGGGGTWATAEAKVGIAVKDSTPSKAIVANNGTVVSDAFTLAQTGSVSLGSWGTTQYPYNYFERLTVWNSKLADATLKALTA